MADHRHWLLDRIKDHNDQTALALAEKISTYSEIHEQVLHYLDILDGEIPRGSIVAILSDYNFQAISLFIALMQNQCVIAPITHVNPAEIESRLKEGYVQYRLSFDSEGNIIIQKVEEVEKMHPLIASIVAKKNSGLVLFSSGSSGKPKAMIHDLDQLCNSYRNKRNKPITMMVFLMFDHIGGLNTLLNAMSMGAMMVIPSTRNAEHVCSLIQTHRVQILPASPTFLNMILMNNMHELYDLSSLRMISYGTESMPESLLQRIKNAFPKAKLLQTFGTSETGIAQTVSKSSTSTYMKINDPDVEHKVVDGELWLRSKTQISGYLNASMERFSADGWFKTGDLVDEDEDGYIKIIGRSQEVINVGGEKALPSEIESVLLQNPEILDCAVFPEPNSITGQHVAAKIVLKNPMTNREASKFIRQFCKGKLDMYKMPAKVYVVEQTSHSDRFKKQRNL